MAAETPADFEDTPRGWHQRWKMELEASAKELEKFHVSGQVVEARFRDERDTKTEDDTRWTLFSSNITTLQAMLYGRTPQVSVGRRFADADDDDARVAGEMLERALNSDIEKDGDSYAIALEQALSDRLLPGFGNARVRYEAQFETDEGTPALIGPPTQGPSTIGPDGVEIPGPETPGVELAPAIPPQERKVRESVETDYLHWRDQRWSAKARVFREWRWWGHRAEMSRAELRQRFTRRLNPEDPNSKTVGDAVPLNAKGSKEDRDNKRENPWARAEVWEIWDKETRRVFWYCEAFSETLDDKPDPYGLDGFWPFPRPMSANLTTSTTVPRADFVLAQDLYDDIDRVSSRITLLQRAVRVAGLYNGSNGDELKKLLSDAEQNQLYPVKNWSQFVEKGGIRGQVDWLPLEPIMQAITALREYRTELVQTLYQVTGWSDIMRGQAAGGGVTATEQGIKARFGSVRVQRLQDEFARFASDLQRLKAELMSKHFEPGTIVERSNVMRTPDAERAPAAVALLKSGLADYRIEVKPEAISLTDFAAQKQESMDVLAGIGAFIQATAGVAAQSPATQPYLLRILQWSMARVKGASTIEGVLDQAIGAAEKAAEDAKANPQAAAPDPKLLAQQMKGQQDQAKIQAELQADITRTQVEVEADGQRERTQAIENTREAAAKAQISALQRAAQPAPNTFRNPRGGVP